MLQYEMCQDSLDIQYFIIPLLTVTQWHPFCPPLLSFPLLPLFVHFFPKKSYDYGKKYISRGLNGSYFRVLTFLNSGHKISYLSFLTFISFYLRLKISLSQNLTEKIAHNLRSIDFGLLSAVN